MGEHAVSIPEKNADYKTRKTVIPANVRKLIRHMLVIGSLSRRRPRFSVLPFADKEKTYSVSGATGTQLEQREKCSLIRDRFPRASANEEYWRSRLSFGSGPQPPRRGDGRVDEEAL